MMDINSRFLIIYQTAKKQFLESSLSNPRLTFIDADIKNLDSLIEHMNGHDLI